MLLDRLKPNIIVRGPIFPEPVQVIVAIPMGTSVKLVGKGLTNQVHEPILSAEQLKFLMPDALAQVWCGKFMDILQHHESSALLKDAALRGQLGKWTTAL